MKLFALLLFFVSCSVHARLENVVMGRGTLVRLEKLVEDHQDVIGIELWEVSGVKGDLARSFGHMALRFVDSDEDPLNDIVYSYYPETGGAAPDPYKSLTGFYDLALEINTVEVFAERYFFEDRVYVRRLPVLSNALLRRAVVRESIDRLNNQGKRGKYYGLSNNCLGALLIALKDAGFPFDGASVFLPLTAKDYLNRRGLAPFSFFQANPPSQKIVERHMIRRYLHQQFQALPKEIYGLCKSMNCASRVLRHLEDRYSGSAYKVGRVIGFKTSASDQKLSVNHANKGGARFYHDPIRWGAFRHELDQHYKLLRQVRLRSKNSRAPNRP